jgi:hypothetical protein
LDFGIHKRIPNHSVSIANAGAVIDPPISNREPSPVKKITFKFQNSRSTIDLSGLDADDVNDSALASATRVERSQASALDLPIRQKIPSLDEPIDTVNPLPLRQSFLRALQPSMRNSLSNDHLNLTQLAAIASLAAFRPDQHPAIYHRTQEKLRQDLFKLRFKVYELSFMTAVSQLRDSYWNQITADLNMRYSVNFRKAEYKELAEYLYQKEIRKIPSTHAISGTIRAPVVLPVREPKEKHTTQTSAALKDLRRNSSC